MRIFSTGPVEATRIWLCNLGHASNSCAGCQKGFTSSPLFSQIYIWVCVPNQPAHLHRHCIIVAVAVVKSSTKRLPRSSGWERPARPPSTNQTSWFILPTMSTSFSFPNKVSHILIKRNVELTWKKIENLLDWLSDGVASEGSNAEVTHRPKIWRGGASSSVVGIICPPGWNRVNWSAKNWGGAITPLPTPFRHPWTAISPNISDTCSSSYELIIRLP